MNWTPISSKNNRGAVIAQRRLTRKVNAANKKKPHCFYCGQTILRDGTSRHTTKAGEVDYDRDADHVAVSDQERPI